MLPAPAFAAFACAFSLAFADFWPLPPPIFFFVKFRVFGPFFMGGIFLQKDDAFLGKISKLRREREREPGKREKKKTKKKNVFLVFAAILVATQTVLLFRFFRFFCFWRPRRGQRETVALLGRTPPPPGRRQHLWDEIPKEQRSMLSSSRRER